MVGLVDARSPIDGLEDMEDIMEERSDKGLDFVLPDKLPKRFSCRGIKEAGVAAEAASAEDIKHW